ncbi:unnamed protein product [Merluccius merluccius]
MCCGPSVTLSTSYLNKEVSTARVWHRPVRSCLQSDRSPLGSDCCGCGNLNVLQEVMVVIAWEQPGVVLAGFSGAPTMPLGSGSAMPDGEKRMSHGRKGLSWDAPWATLLSCLSLGNRNIPLASS